MKGRHSRAVRIAWWSAAAAVLAGACASGAEIGIQGLRSVSEREVLELLDARLEHVRAKPPSASRASDAAFLLESLLRRGGFEDPSVEWSIAGNRIELRAREGARFELGQVELPGVEKKEARRLERLFGRPAQERKLLPGDDPPFQEEDVAEGTTLLEADYQSRGYWTAKVTVSKQIKDRTRGRVHLILRVEPGPLHRIGRARFEGVPDWLLPEMRRRASGYEGLVAATAELTKFRGEMESGLRSSGHEIVKFDVSRVLERGVLVPVVSVVTGQRRRQGDIEYVGLGKTKPERVMARFENLEGDWHDPEEIDKRVRKLLGTGAFRSIQVENTPQGEMLDTTLRFRESIARGVAYYGGVSSTDGAVFGARYHDRNLGGNLWNLATGFELAGRGLLGEIRLSDPWFMNTETHFGGRLFSVTRYYEGYSKFETGASAEWTWDLDERWSVSVLAAASLVNIEPDGIPRPDLGETVYGHHRVRANVRYEARDDRLSPRGGYHAQAVVEAGLTAGDESANYTLLEAGGGWYREIGPGQLNLGARFGMIETDATGREFPIDLRYFIGGSDTVRSFAYRELGPLARGGDPVGGQSYWVANAEWVQPLAGLLKGVVFVDAGSLSESGGFGGTAEVAAGLGVRLDLPVGPIRFEYGHNLTRDAGEPGGAFHFAIGIAF